MFLLQTSTSLLAQAVDTISLINRLDRLEQKNQEIDEKNKRLEKQLRELQSTYEKRNEAEKKKPEEEKKAETAQKVKKQEAREEGLTVGRSLKMEGSWKNALWFETPDKAFKWAVGGVIHSDLSFFNADKNVVRSVGQFNNLTDPGLSLSDGFSFRRARLRFSGTMWEQIEFFSQYEFATALDLRRRTLGVSPASVQVNDFDPGDDVGFNEVYIGFTKIPILGSIRIGRHRESMNFITATADNNQVWLERGLMADAFTADFNFSNGITIQNTYLDDRFYAYFGIFHVNNNSTRGFYAVGDGEYAYDTRLTCLPVWNEPEKIWVHLGVDYSYRNLHANQTRFRARSMIRSGPSFLTPNLLNSGDLFSRDATQLVNFEIAAAYGRWTFTTEYCYNWTTNVFSGGLPRQDGTLPAGVISRGTYEANGGYVELLYFLTDDHRRYKKDRPGQDRVVPNENFYFLDGESGWIFAKGAWEIGARYDYVDLTNSGVNGGMANAITGCVNWYLNPNARIQHNLSWMNRSFNPSDLTGRVNGEVWSYGVRFNVDF